MSVRPGTRLDGRYRLSERLAYGGMGEVWRATDEVLSREVAVKILRPELAEDEAFVRRFRAEARTTSGLPHNGIAAVYDYGETRVGSDGQSPAPYDDPDADPVAYLVMELVPGEALSSILSRDGALGSDLTLDLVAQAARALHAAHLLGVIHRDIKPANLMVTPDGRVKVTDFGIARPLDHEPLTATGQVMGTAHYLAPELAKGQDASALSDVYALGVVAYECLAGHRPFEGDNQVAVALAHLNEQPPPLSGAIPEAVRAVVGAAMEKDPHRRMPSAEAFAAALETLRYHGEDQLTPATGVLPGSAVEAGLRASGLLPQTQGGWTPGLPSGRTGAPIGAGQASAPVGMPPSGAHLLGPAGPPHSGAMSGGLPVGGPGGYGQVGPDAGSSEMFNQAGAGYGYGYGDPNDPFRTPTAPGGLSITPGDRSGERRSFSGPLLALAALALVVIVAGIVVFFNSDNPGSVVPKGDDSTPTARPTATSPSLLPEPSLTNTKTSTSRNHSKPTTTTSKAPAPTNSSPTTSPTSSPSKSPSLTPTQPTDTATPPTTPSVTPPTSTATSTAGGTSTSAPPTATKTSEPTGTATTTG